MNFLYLLSSILTAKILGTSYFGLYSLGWAVVGIGSVLAGLGLTDIPSKFIPEYIHRKDKGGLKGFLAFLFKIQLFSGIVTALLIILASNFISVRIYKEPGLALFLILLSGLIPFQKMREIFSGVFKGFKKLTYSIYLNCFFEPAYRFLFIICVFIVGGHIKGVFASLYSGAILTLIFLSIIYRRKIYVIFFSEQTKHVPCVPCKKNEIIGYSLPLLGVSLVSYFTGKTDILMIGYFLTPDKVGIYNIAFKLSLVVALSLLSLNMILSPLVSEMHIKKDMKKLEASYKSFTRIALYVSVFVLSSFILISKPLLSFINRDFVSGFYPLIMLSIGQLINVSTGPGGIILIMTKYPRLNFYNSAGLLAANIILNLLLIPRYGMLGAAAATSISIAFLNLIRIIEIYAIFGIHPYSRGYFKPIIAGILSLAFVKTLTIFIPGSNSLVLFIFFSMLYALLALLMGLSVEERYMLSLIKNYGRAPDEKK